MKAELLRKQQEVSKTNKPTATDPFKVFNPKRSNLSGEKKKRNESAKPKSATETVPERISLKETVEDSEMLAKSKRILEAKARLYDRMTASGGSLNSDDRCLVRFNQKKQDERSIKPISDDSSESDSDNERHTKPLQEDDDDDDEKWTEYTDCLGRTRKCLKEDVDFFRKKDQELAQVAKDRSATKDDSPPPSSSQDQKWFIDTKGISSADLPFYKSANPAGDDDTLSMFSKSTKAEEMRQQWERKEQENYDRDQIHYQDVLFDEARTHGVGYYAFAVDENERLKQQNELQAERERTLQAQKQRDQVRENREKILADRIFAAKNRQRARSGLPPLDREEMRKAEEKEKEDKLNEERKLEMEKEKNLRKKEKLESEREGKRQQHLRPWDHGKDGAPSTRKFDSDSDDDTEWKYKPEKPEPMSQEQWNEKKRLERNPEFAPPAAAAAVAAIPVETDFEYPDSKSFNRFTTIKPKTFKRRNAEPVGNMFNAPIRNELDGNDFPVDDDRTEEVKHKRTEIPPPPTFDYYGPTSSGSRSRTQNPNNDISSSIDAGLKFLREQSDKGNLGTKQAWVANTSYEQS